MMRKGVALIVVAMCAAGYSKVSPTQGDDNSESRRFTGELTVYDTFEIGDGDERASAPRTLAPGTYVGNLERLRRQRLVIDVDVPGSAELTVLLNEDAGEFPRGEAEFLFTAAQHNLPYTIIGSYAINESIVRSNTSSQECGDVLYETVNVSNDLALTFVDPQRSAVVARYFAASKPNTEIRTTPLRGSCGRQRPSGSQRGIPGGFPGETPEGIPVGIPR